MDWQGKAAIDVVCNPLGKSGGSAIQQALIIGFGSLAASTPYLGIILLGVVVMWIGAANSLNKQVRPDLALRACRPRPELHGVVLACGLASSTPC